ncbi:MAG: hypothetical protein H7145_13040, partial [Akkermansiaceae bacterium]|nr:hypothetical protein [Armatimonadota bacterium]
LSGWSEYCHAQYRRYWEKTHGPFTEAETALLAEHAEIRRRRGWGSLEPIFYTPKGLEAALADPRLGTVDATTERRVFAAFAPRIEEMMASESGPSERFVEKIERKRPELAAFATKAARLFGAKSLRLPVYLFANPADSDIGGGYNGGVLTLEIPRKADAFPPFLHEVFHAFLEPHGPALAAATQGIPGLNSETLNEGLAYALSPGIIHSAAPGADPLRAQVAADFRNGKRLSDSYTRFNRFGLALRPLVQRSLEDPHVTFAAVLPRAVDTWRTLAELSGAFQPPERPRIFSFGPAWEELNERSWGLGYWLRAYGHLSDDYRQTLASLPKGATVFLLYTPDFDPALRDVPVEYRDLLPKSLEEINAAVSRGADVEAEGNKRGLRVVLLGAPTMERLKSLIAKTKLLPPAPPPGDTF